MAKKERKEPTTRSKAASAEPGPRRAKANAPRLVESSEAAPSGRSANSQPTHEEIARRAYEIFLDRGAEPGREVDDWLKAESELKRSA